MSSKICLFLPVWHIRCKHNLAQPHRHLCRNIDAIVHPFLDDKNCFWRSSQHFIIWGFPSIYVVLSDYCSRSGIIAMIIHPSRWSISVDSLSMLQELCGKDELPNILSNHKCSLHRYTFLHFHSILIHKRSYFAQFAIFKQRTIKSGRYSKKYAHSDLLDSRGIKFLCSQEYFVNGKRLHLGSNMVNMRSIQKSKALLLWALTVGVPEYITFYHVCYYSNDLRRKDKVVNNAKQ